MKVLLSIKPEFVAKIESGEKVYEYRKTIFRRPDIKTVVVYATSPVCRIVGEFDIESIESGTPQEIWQRTHSQGGVTKRFYNNYFKKSNVAYAIKIAAYRKYPSQMKIEEAYPNMTAPQSFKYIVV